MFTRKQHYYPRCLLKHFANENKMIYVHIRQANKKAFMNYEKVCVATDAYETEDNLLTSDNPVIATDNWNQIMLPITPNILIEFQEDKINSSNDLRVILKKIKQDM
ncbi:DUF4238 domain-containing protein [Staphylococcus epidermidis]|uniref:DUF4238 domain-containing protein n=1 Tax=Staphylococcus epidermidis TaxID=1282 RepID=UPI00039AA782|nr:DUF4238 domain-containing protein [Staphylococcus epidermidis]